MLNRDSDDIRDNIRRMAAALDDLTRSRVLALSDADFAEYVSLTLPHAASKKDAPPLRAARIGSRACCNTVSSTPSPPSAPISSTRGQSRGRLRRLRLQLLAHFHGLAPGLERVSVKALKRRHVDINDPEIRPIVFHYLRSTLETLGVDRPPDRRRAVDRGLVSQCRLRARRDERGCGGQGCRPRDLQRRAAGGVGRLTRAERVAGLDIESLQRGDRCLVVLHEGSSLAFYTKVLHEGSSRTIVQNHREEPS